MSKEIQEQESCEMICQTKPLFVTYECLFVFMFLTSLTKGGKWERDG